MSEPLVRLRPRGASAPGDGPDAAGERARLRLLVCPPSGAGAQYARPLLRPDVDLWSARYPGRETRRHEPPPRDLHAPAREIAEAVRRLPAGGPPLVVLGHSMGAGVAVEVTRLLQACPPVPVAALLLSARVAPGSRDRADDLELRRIAGDDATLRAWLTRLGGIPEELLHDDDFMALHLPVVRADLLASLGHDALTGRPPLDVPVLLLCGDADPVVDLDSMAGWAALTRGPTDRVELLGGHDAVVTDADAVHDAIRAAVHATPDRRLAVVPS